jgi:hypothetical protein
MSRLALTFIIFLFSFSVWGQWGINGFIDAGSSTASGGPFVRPSMIVDYHAGDYFGSSGFQFTLPGDERKTFSGWYLQGGKDFSLRDFAFSAALFCMVVPFSALTRESNAGLLFKHNRDHIELHFGYHMRNYRMNLENLPSADPSSVYDPNIWEFRNFIYRGTLRLHAKDAPWNLSASFTNYDHFQLQQETNPMISLEGNYRINNAFSLYSSIWYRGAGMLNLHPNFYGFYFRTGLQWQLGE